MRLDWAGVTRLGEQSTKKLRVNRAPAAQGDRCIKAVETEGPGSRPNLPVPKAERAWRVG